MQVIVTDLFQGLKDSKSVATQRIQISCVRMFVQTIQKWSFFSNKYLNKNYKMLSIWFKNNDMEIIKLIEKNG